MIRQYTWKEESMLSFLCPWEPAFVKDHANLSFKYISFRYSWQHSSVSYNDYLTCTHKLIRNKANKEQSILTQCQRQQEQLPWKKTLQSWIIHLLLLFAPEAVSNYMLISQLQTCGGIYCKLTKIKMNLLVAYHSIILKDESACNDGNLTK
jgi:hypothetical protein